MASEHSPTPLTDDDRQAVRVFDIILSSVFDHSYWKDQKDPASRLGDFSDFLGLLGLSAATAFKEQSHVIWYCLGQMAQREAMADPYFHALEESGSSFVHSKNEWKGLELAPGLRRAINTIVREYAGEGQELSDFLMGIVSSFDKKDQKVEASIWAQETHRYLSVLSSSTVDMSSRVSSMKQNAIKWIDAAASLRSQSLENTAPKGLDTELNKERLKVDQALKGSGMVAEKSNQVAAAMARSIFLASPERFEEDLNHWIGQLDRHRKAAPSPTVQDQVSMVALKLSTLFHGLHNHSPQSPEVGRYQTLAEATLSWLFKVNPVLSAPLSLPVPKSESYDAKPSTQADSVGANGAKGAGGIKNGTTPPSKKQASTPPSLPAFGKPAHDLLFTLLLEPTTGRFELPQDKVSEDQITAKILEILDKMDSNVKDRLSNPNPSGSSRALKDQPPAEPSLSALPGYTPGEMIQTQGHYLPAVARLASACLLKLITGPSQDTQTQLIDACQSLSVASAQSAIYDQQEESLALIQAGFKELQKTWITMYHHVLEWDDFAQKLEEAGLKEFSGIARVSQLDEKTSESLNNVDVQPLSLIRQGLKTLISEGKVNTCVLTSELDAHLESSVGRVRSQLEALELRELIKPKAILKSAPRRSL